MLSNSDNFENIDYDLFCGVNTDKDLKKITKEDLNAMLDGSEDFQILDVRQEYEQPRIDVSTSLNGQVLVAPLNVLESYVYQISKNKKVIVVCQHGIRSVGAIEYLESQHGFDNLINLENGLAD